MVKWIQWGNSNGIQWDNINGIQWDSSMEINGMIVRFQWISMEV